MLTRHPRFGPAVATGHRTATGRARGAGYLAATAVLAGVVLVAVAAFAVSGDRRLDVLVVGLALAAAGALVTLLTNPVAIVAAEARPADNEPVPPPSDTGLAR